MSQRIWTASRLKAIGRRLCDGRATIEDEAIFDQYIAAHDAVLVEISDALRDLGLSATPRLKTRKTLLEKVGRGTDLARMEDIAGLRLPPCADWHSQDELAQLIEARFPDAFRRDRRKTPSAGYRAVHLIVRGTNGCAVEIQIRTHLQHAWAEIFEKFTDLIGREYRYGAVPTAPGARVVFETLQKVAETFHGAEEATEGLRLAEGVPQVSESRAALLDQAHRLVVSSKARCQKVIDILPSVLAEFEAPSDQPSSGEV